VDDATQDLIEQADHNALLRVVDGLCASSQWDALVELADRCELALERGKQLWPIASHIDYRLALEAPGEYAADVLVPNVGRFSHGPLSEVAASTHTWEELADHIEIPQAAAYTAQERVLRGEDLRSDERVHAEVLDLPFVLESWEPAYPTPVFKATYAEVPEVWEPSEPLVPTDTRAAETLHEPELQDTLLDLVLPWTTESNGAASTIVVEGDAASAVSGLTAGGLRIGRLSAQEVLQRMAWAAASGGAYGRRRGGALGRFLAWSTVAALADFSWPARPGEIEAGLTELEWFRWDEGDEEEGWVLRLAVADPDRGWAAAIGATDVRNEEEEEL
jgi:hypothetical protein